LPWSKITRVDDVGEGILQTNRDWRLARDARLENIATRLATNALNALLLTKQVPGAQVITAASVPRRNGVLPELVEQTDPCLTAMNL
jgi:hypothetical protein